MSQKSKTILLLLLLVLSLSGAIYTAKAAIGAVGGLHAQQKLYQSGDVRAIRPWMTIAYIAHTYHVPESYLYQALGIKDRRQYQGTLQTIAGRLKRPVNDIIHSVQQAILAYRKQHPLPPALPGRAYMASFFIRDGNVGKKRGWFICR
ncbi:MAG: hypothetical protein IMW89_19875 [Ktedonobacteraceae bacterium]|nr:hypothetical protein [Ktedonobacteraceae bacterium]